MSEIQQHPQHRTGRSPPREKAGSYARIMMLGHKIGIMKPNIKHGSK
jgi:hypothetical protein